MRVLFTSDENNFMHQRRQENQIYLKNPSLTYPNPSFSKGFLFSLSRFLHAMNTMIKTAITIRGIRTPRTIAAVGSSLLTGSAVGGAGVGASGGTESEILKK